MSSEEEVEDWEDLENSEMHVNNSNGIISQHICPIKKQKPAVSASYRRSQRILARWD